MHIPESLWQRNVLHLPKDLNEVYQERLEELSLLATAKRFDGKQGGHGGISQAETYKHFASLYPNSATRVQCVLVDPHGVFSEISRDLILTLASHRIALLDIPSGSGAGGIALLTTIKELRVADVIPKMPLSVHILAADISGSALELYQSQIDKLRPRLGAEGIRVTLECREWDATQLQDTAELIEDYLSIPSNEYLVLMANFSGAGKTQFAKFQRSFEHIFVRLSLRRVRRVTLLWVEPSGDSGEGFIKKLKNLVITLRGYITKVKEPEPCLKCKYTWWSYIQAKTVNSDVAVHDYRRDDRP